MQTDLLTSMEQRHFWRVGRYVVCTEIALGGAASVHLGRVAGPGGFVRLVVIKRLHPHLIRSAEHVAMFIDEARITSRIRHPNVVAPIDVVVENREPFMVMEYVDGVTLGDLLSICQTQRERPPISVLASVFVDVLRGLQAAHEARSEQGAPLNIVHRDVSPSNIIIGCDGVARVLDFGIAKARMRIGATTRTGQFKGKLGYIAPEQLTGGPVDARADVFAAAVVFWEALTLTPLFDALTEAEAAGRTLNLEVRPPSSLNPDVPAELDLVLLRALRRDPKARYQSAEAFGHAIERAISVGTARAVGKWVQRTGADVLARRAHLLDEVERTLDDCERLPEEEMPLVAKPNQFTATGPPATITLAPTPVAARADHRWLAYAALPIALAAYLLLPAGLLRRNVEPDAAPAAQAATLETLPGSEHARGANTAPSIQLEPVPVVSDAPSAPSEPVAAPAPASAEAPSVLDLDAESSSEVAVVKETPKPAAARVRPRYRVQRAPKQNCNPPFIVDPRGIRRIKPNCV